MHIMKKDSIALSSDFNYVIEYYYNDSEFYVKIDNPSSPTRAVKAIRAFFKSDLVDMYDYECYSFTLNNAFKLSSFQEQIQFMLENFKKYA